jgi:serine/threonine protein kinase
MAKDPLELVGSVVDDRYRVDAVVDDGDLTVTYKGRDLKSDKLVSIRCLNVPSTLDPALTAPFIRSFRERTRLHCRLAPSHSSFVQTTASGDIVTRRTRMTVPYEIREWLDGSTFAAFRAKRRAENGGRWTIEAVLPLLEPVATGLAYLHDQGLVHCEINPHNLLVAVTEGEPTVKLVDVGEGRAANGKSEPQPVLRVLMPEYTAPEQVDKLVGAIGPHTDVFSLAVIVVECLAGGLGTEGVAAVVVIDPENRPSPQKLGLSLPPSLEEVLERALSLDPARRPADAAIFWRELQEAAVWVSADDVASTRIKVLPAKLVESAAVRVASSAPPKGPSNPISKRTLAGLQPGGPIEKVSRPPLPPRVAASPRASEAPRLPFVAPEVVTPEAPDESTETNTTTVLGEELLPAENPLPKEGTEAVSPGFVPALGGGLSGASPLRVAAARGRERIVLEWVRLRAWAEKRAWPWLVTRVSRATPRARALFAASAVVAVLLVALVVKAFVAVAHGKAEGKRLPLASPSASVAALAEIAPAQPAAPSAPAETAIELPPPAPAPRPEVAAAFTRAAAVTALEAAGGDLLECRTLGDLSGPATLRATFDRNGVVTRIHINPPYTDTPEGACILDRFGRAQMTPFRGPVGTLNYTFDVPQ